MKSAGQSRSKSLVFAGNPSVAQEATAAALDADCRVAKLDAEADERLAAEQLVDRITAVRSRTRAELLATRCELESRRLVILDGSREDESGARAFDAQLPLFCAMAATCGVGAWLLIPRFGLMGAPIALAAAACVQIAGEIAILTRALRREPAR